MIIFSTIPDGVAEVAELTTSAHGAEELRTLPPIAATAKCNQPRRQEFKDDDSLPTTPRYGKNIIIMR